MKTTIDLPDDLFREAKATAARRGAALKEFFREALAEKLEREGRLAGDEGTRSWPVPPPDVPLEELRRIHAIIEEEFEQFEPEDQL